MPLFNKPSSGSTQTIPRGLIAGLILSNDGTSPNSVIDVAAGQCVDSTAATFIALAAFTKSTAGAWATGSGSNGMGNGLAVASNTWYHVFAAVISGVADVFFDTSVTAANAPTGTTAFRRLGSFLTDGSAHVTAFTQVEDTFYWGAVRSDVSTAALGTTATLYTMSAPLGVRTRLIARMAAPGGIAIVITSPAEPAPSPGR